MKTRFLVVILALAVGLVAADVWAQTGIAKGKVVDGTGEAAAAEHCRLHERQPGG